MTIRPLLVTAPRFQRGFTLVETIVVISIIGVLAAISISLFNLQKTTAFESSVQEIVANLRKMQSEARIVDGNLEYGMSFTSNGWSTFSNNPTSNVQTTLQSKTLSNVTVSTAFVPSATQVIFSRLTGQLKNGTTGTVTVSISNPNRSKIIQVQSSGVVYVQ